MSVFYCDLCQSQQDSDFVETTVFGGDLVCVDCFDEEFEKQKADWEPLYRGEKVAGLVK